MLCKYLGVKAKQSEKKHDVIVKINADLQAKRQRKQDESVEIEEKEQELNLNGITVLAREEDGFVNATQLCKAGGKKFNDWKRLGSTSALVDVLKSETGIPAIKLLEVNAGRHGGSWIHPDLAVQLAQWISPVFALQVSRWVRELTILGSVSLGQEKTHQQLLTLQSNIKALEKKHTQLLKRREHHKFKKGPVFYIISDGDSKSLKYKVGIDEVDINVRLAQHRSTTPQIRLEYLLYTDKCGLIESAMLERYNECRKPFLNHEWIYDTDVKHVVSSVSTLVDFLGIQATVENDLEQYNEDVAE